LVAPVPKLAGVAPPRACSPECSAGLFGKTPPPRCSAGQGGSVGTSRASSGTLSRRRHPQLVAGIKPPASSRRRVGDVAMGPASYLTWSLPAWKMTWLMAPPVCVCG
jgi:hypothetical protein